MIVFPCYLFLIGLWQNNKSKYLRDDSDYWYNNKIIKWYDGYKKRKAQKAKIKDELMPIA